LASAPALAQQSLVGAYRLVSLQREIDGKAVPTSGKPSHGHLVFASKTYVLLLTDGTRKYGSSVEDKAALWESLTAHAGTTGSKVRSS
jgi:hypothetical protein